LPISSIFVRLFISFISACWAFAFTDLHGVLFENFHLYAYVALLVALKRQIRRLHGSIFCENSVNF